MEHQAKYRLARQMHDADVKLSRENKKYWTYSADMKKVDTLPELPALQESFFLSGEVAYNETFSPARPCSEEDPNIFMLWHEAISGRDSPDVTSSYWKFFEEIDKRVQAEGVGKVHLIVWVDNCTAQVSVTINP